MTQPSHAVNRKDRRALAQALTNVERGGTEAREALRTVPWELGATRVVGITGPPGAGKSTLVDQLLAAWARHGTHVAVLAVDPTSPITSGALLGDRVRMGRHDVSDLVMIRSVATRGANGGVSSAVPSMIRLFAHAGFDVVLVETVGVGQIELDIAALADVTVLVAAPGLGDGVQAAKAGILEIADVFVVNKADLPGASRTVDELTRANHMSGAERPIVSVTATTGRGVADVLAAIEGAWSIETTSVKRHRRASAELSAVLRTDFAARLAAVMDHPETIKTVDSLIAGECSFEAAFEHISARVTASQ